MCSCYLLFQIQNRPTEFQIRNEFNQLYYSYCKIMICSKVLQELVANIVKFQLFHHLETNTSTELHNLLLQVLLECVTEES